MRKIYYKTRFFRMREAELKKLLGTDNDKEARIELILRSRYAGDHRDSINIEYIMQIAKDGIKKYPDHPIFNYVLGSFYIEIKDFSTAKKYFLKVHQHPEIKTIASAQLSNIFGMQKKYLQMAVFFFYAMINNIADTENLLLKGKISSMATSSNKKQLTFLQTLILITSIFCGKKYTYLEYELIFNTLDPKTIEPILYLNSHSNPLQVLITDPIIDQLIKGMIDQNPTDYLNFYAYCLEHDLLNPYILKDIIIHYIENNGDVKLRDEATYCLTKILIKLEMFDEAKECIKRVSKTFVDFKLDDINKAPQPWQDQLSKIVFRELFKRQIYEAALTYIKNIEDPHYYTKDMLKMFTFQPHFAANYDLLILKKQMIERIFNRKDLIIQDREMLNLINEINSLISNPQLWASEVTNCLVQQLLTAKNSAANPPNKASAFGVHFQQLFKHPKIQEPIATLIDKIQSLIQTKSIFTKIDAKNYFDEVLDLIQKYQERKLNKEEQSLLMITQLTIEDARHQLFASTGPSTEKLGDEGSINDSYPQILSVNVPGVTIIPQVDNEGDRYSLQNEITPTAPQLNLIFTKKDYDKKNELLSSNQVITHDLIDFSEQVQEEQNIPLKYKKF